MIRNSRSSKLLLKDEELFIFSGPAETWSKEKKEISVKSVSLPRVERNFRRDSM